MAYADLKAKIDTLLQVQNLTTQDNVLVTTQDGLQFGFGVGLIEAPEQLSLDSVPSSGLDRCYTVAVDELSENSEFCDKYDRFYPNCKFTITIGFDTHNGDPNFYALGIAELENVARTIINPNNYEAQTRIIDFVGVKTKTVANQDNFLLGEVSFKANYILQYA